MTEVAARREVVQAYVDGVRDGSAAMARELGEHIRDGQRLRVSSDAGINLATAVLRLDFRNCSPKDWDRVLQLSMEVTGAK